MQLSWLIYPLKKKKRCRPPWFPPETWQLFMDMLLVSWFWSRCTATAYLDNTDILSTSLWGCERSCFFGCCAEPPKKRKKGRPPAKKSSVAHWLNRLVTVCRRRKQKRPKDVQNVALELPSTIFFNAVLYFIYCSVSWNSSRRLLKYFI